MKLGTMKTEELLQTPYWIMDVLPAQVPENSPGQYFRIEKYLREQQMPDIRQRYVRVILKLNCYREIEMDGKKNPEPARLAGAVAGRATRLITGDSLILSEPDDTYITIYHPDEELLKLLKELAAAEGLFVWKP